MGSNVINRLVKSNDKQNHYYFTHKPSNKKGKGKGALAKRAKDFLKRAKKVIRRYVGHGKSVNNARTQSLIRAVMSIINRTRAQIYSGIRYTGNKTELRKIAYQVLSAGRSLSHYQAALARYAINKRRVARRSPRRSFLQSNMTWFRRTSAFRRMMNRHRNIMMRFSWYRRYLAKRHGRRSRKYRVSRRYVRRPRRYVRRPRRYRRRYVRRTRRYRRRYVRRPRRYRRRPRRYRRRYRRRTFLQSNMTWFRRTSAFRRM